MEQQDDTLMQLNEELVAAKESLQSSCLQNKMLQRDKEQLGLLLLFIILGWSRVQGKVKVKSALI